MALRFAQVAGVNAYIVDPVTVDEWQPSARLSGSPLLERTPIGHALNIKAVVRRYAREQGRGLAQGRVHGLSGHEPVGGELAAADPDEAVRVCADTVLP